MRRYELNTDEVFAYRSPRTGARLRLDAENLVSTDGSESFPLHEGIPCFLRYPPIVDEQLILLNRVAAESGWLKGVHQVYGQSSAMSRYVDTTQRAAFFPLIPLSQSATVLEIGIGFGQITVDIAKRVKCVFALEVRCEQAIFARIRCLSEGLGNVSFACGGDDCRLPYPDRAVDAAILNLVFEWSASRNVEEPGETGQGVLLSEVFRVLRPGGSLFLATKNRFALRYLLGKCDEHAFGMRFGHALPKWLMNFLLRRRGHAQPGGNLHSYRHLTKMLRAAGFVDLKSYWAAPEMRYPKWFNPTDVNSIRKARKDPAFIQGEYRSTRLLMPMIPNFAVKYFTPGLLFVSRKPY